MRVAFVDRIGWDYRPDTVYREPLGGSQSAVCYLTAALARRGVQVALVNHTTQPGEVLGVQCHAIEGLPSDFWSTWDAVVVFNEAGGGLVLRETLMTGPDRQPRLILWTQHDVNQPAMQPLHDRLERTVYDRFVFVSEWQRQQYLTAFGLPPERTQVLPNAIAPFWEGLVDTEREPLLVYTSTPFRGLADLLEMWPTIHQQFPQARLAVFSSMKVYRSSEASDRAAYGELYDRCQRLPGVIYRGSVSQPELAQALQKALILAYPNTFPETYCIAAVEALAAGCHVVTSRLGALPETTAGWATLIPLGVAYRTQFVAAVCRVLQDWQSPGLRQHRQQQMQQIQAVNTWERRAAAWEAWLQEVCRPEPEPIAQAPGWDPENPWAVLSCSDRQRPWLRQQAEFLERRLDFEGAAFLRELLHEDGPDGSNTYALARDYLAAGRLLEDAERLDVGWHHLQAALTADPENPEILWQMAIACEERGESAAAEGYWQAALARCPGLSVLRG